MISYGYSVPTAGLLSKINEYIFGSWQPNLSTMALERVVGSDGDNAATITAAHNAGVTVTFQLYAPWSTPAYNIVFTDAAKRNALFASISTVLNYGFDGVNFDWESDNVFNGYTAADVSDFYQALSVYLAVHNPSKTISATENYDGAVTMTAAAQTYLQWIGLMVYDVAPASSWYGTLAQVHSCVDKWTAAGISAVKLVVGINFMGLRNGSWSDGAMSYSSILSSANPLESSNAATIGGAIYYYNGADLVQNKAQIVVNESLGGVFAYYATLDNLSDPRSLLQHIYDTLYSTLSPPTNVQATDGTSTSRVTVTWTKSIGATGYRVYRDGADISGALGDTAGYDDVTAAPGAINAGSTIASDGANASHVSLALSGTVTSHGPTYTYKVRAFNSSITSGDSNTNTGYVGIGTLTYQWQRSAADSNASYSNLTGATTAMYSDTTAPIAGTGRYYRCILNATGVSQATSTPDRGYRLYSPLPPTTVPPAPTPSPSPSSGGGGGGAGMGIALFIFGTLAVIFVILEPSGTARDAFGRFTKR